VQKLKPIYQLKTKEDNAELYIYGDIASDSYKWSESDISANDIVNQLQSVHASKIDVYINSYGGEVAQGLAIYNALKRHKAKVTTYVDGFACSIASVIAMAGDVRKMYDNSLLMIHNAWTTACGNVEELLKQAEDLKTINDATKKAYLEVVNIDEAELTALLDAETWLTAEKAVEMGFATEIVAAKKPEKASASAQSIICAMLTKAAEVDPEEEEEIPEEAANEGDVEAVLADIVSRLEKLESEVFKQEEQEEQEEREENPAPEEKANQILQKFLNAIQK
jgi:ATP-dependent Clp protease protease subunit